MIETQRAQYTKVQKLTIFKAEFLPFIDSMYNFAYRLTYNDDDAKDLVQETYLKAFRFINSYHKRTNAKAWLFRILKNSFINDYRKKSKEPAKVDYQEVENFYNSEEVNRQITPDLRVETLQNLIGDEVSVALNSLAVDFKRCQFGLFVVQVCQGESLLNDKEFCHQNLSNFGRNGFHLTFCRLVHGIVSATTRGG